jgi:UDP-N-acetylmuramyl pentapeptide phosphotransferase/UDP-N-acetylglucosamine-1-phosphate transferase
MLLFLVLAGLVMIVSYWLTSRLVDAGGRFGALDRPGVRSLHSEPVPRTGGLAILASGAAGLVLGFGLSGVTHVWSPIDGVGIRSVLAGMTVVALVSFWTDTREVAVAIRLATHVAAGVFAVWWGGLVVDSLSLPNVGVLPLGAAALPVTVLAVVWMTNLYNFMDGLDGFAGGMTVTGFGCLGVLGWSSGHSTIAWLSLLTVGATAGFLAHNLPPAAIFMGDVGSVSLGFLAATLSLIGVRDRLFDVWVPILVFSPFVVDATVTLVRRLLRGEHIWRAHREHAYQRLVLSGWGHRRTLRAEYALMIVTGTTALVYVRVDALAQLCILVAWTILYCLLGCRVRTIAIARSER